jgi:hypothetical protein
MPTHIFTDLYLKSKRQHFRVFVYKSNLYLFFIWNCRISNWNYKMDENSRPRKQARLDTFLNPFLDETRKVKGKLKSKFNQYFTTDGEYIYESANTSNVYLPCVRIFYYRSRVNHSWKSYLLNCLIKVALQILGVFAVSSSKIIPFWLVPRYQTSTIFSR